MIMAYLIMCDSAPGEYIARMPAAIARVTARVARYLEYRYGLRRLGQVDWQTHAEFVEDIAFAARRGTF